MAGSITLTEVTSYGDSSDEISARRNELHGEVSESEMRLVAARCSECLRKSVELVPVDCSLVYCP